MDFNPCKWSKEWKDASELFLICAAPFVIIMGYLMKEGWEDIKR